LIKTGIDIYTHAPLFFTMETRMGGMKPLATISGTI
jgi:hypothetical protein